jgi:hypothetical protein
MVLQDLRGQCAFQQRDRGLTRALADNSRTAPRAVKLCSGTSPDDLFVHCLGQLAAPLLDRSALHKHHGER